jgi:hypothetical protein
VTDEGRKVGVKRSQSGATGNRDGCEVRIVDRVPQRTRG